MELTTQNLNKANDYVIHEVVRYASQYSDEIVATAKSIYTQRDLDSDEKQTFIKNYPNIKEEVYENLEKGKDSEEQMAYLVNNGFEEEQAQDLISDWRIKKLKDKLKIMENEKSNSSVQAWIYGIVFVLVLVKIVLRMAQ